LWSCSCGHNPDGALDLQKKAERDETTHIALEKRFANKYDKEIWGVIEVKKEQDVAIKTEGGSIKINDNTGGEPIRIRIRRQWKDPVHVLVLEVKMKTSTKMDKVIRLYAQKMGVENSFRGLMLDGEFISEIDTPSSLGLEDDDQIDAFLRQCGC